MHLSEKNAPDLNNYTVLEKYDYQQEAQERVHYLRNLRIDAHIPEYNEEYDVYMNGPYTQIFVPPVDYDRAKKMICSYDKNKQTWHRPYTFLVELKGTGAEFDVFIGITTLLFIIIFFLKMYQPAILIGVPVGTGILIFFLSRKQKSETQYFCADDDCRVINGKDAKSCLGCHREIKAIIASHDEILAKEDELGL